MAKTSLKAIMAAPRNADRAKIEATTQDDIRRHIIEDGEDPDAPLSGFVLRRPGERGPGRKRPKVQVALRVDADALTAWRSSGAGWMTRAAELLAREAPRAAAALQERGRSKAKLEGGRNADRARRGNSA